MTAADDSRRGLLSSGPALAVSTSLVTPGPVTRHGDMSALSLESDSEASNSSCPGTEARFGSQTVAPDSPTPYTDAIKVNILGDIIYGPAECQ